MDKETPNKFIGESEKCEKTLCIQVTKIINTLQKSQSFQYIYIYIFINIFECTDTKKYKDWWIENKTLTDR